MDPYAPQVPRRRAGQVGSAVPAARLRRLGASARALGVYQAWWEQLDAEGKTEGFAALALLTDTELERQVADVDALAERSAQQIEAWARKQPNRALAAQLALVAEASRNGGARDGLVRKLVTIR